MNFIADVAGRYEPVKKLLAAMPQERTLFLGDLIDRGPQSREVVELVRSKYECLLGNHEHLFISFVRNDGKYGNTWMMNGGGATMDSYCNSSKVDAIVAGVMNEHTDWMDKLPLFVETDHVFASHAPWSAHEDFEHVQKIWLPPMALYPHERCNPSSLIWNRRDPCLRRFKDADGLSAAPFDKVKLQVFGHNSELKPQHFNEEDDDGVTIPFAMGIDCSRAKVVTGLHVDDEFGLHKVTIYQESY